MKAVNYPVYKCIKCSWISSGVILENEPKNRRWCIKCRSPLFQCDKCLHFVSGTKTEKEVVCDYCKKPVSEKALVC